MLSIGQEVATFEIQGTTESITLPLHGIPVGIYLVRACIGNTTIAVRKLVIAR